MGEIEKMYSFSEFWKAKEALKKIPGPGTYLLPTYYIYIRFDATTMQINAIITIVIKRI